MLKYMSRLNICQISCLITVLFSLPRVSLINHMSISCPGVQLRGQDGVDRDDQCPAESNTRTDAGTRRHGQVSDRLR